MAGNDLCLVSLSAVTWDFALVGRTRMLTEAWRRDNQPTTFVQAPSWRSAAQKLMPRRGAGQDWVIRPWPTAPARFWSRLSETSLRRGIVRRAAGLRKQLERRVDFDNAVAVVISPVWTPWLEALPFRAIIYDCIDDLSVQTPRPELARLFRDWEDELLEHASGAVVTAETLGADIRARRPQLALQTIRNGVDPQRFREIAASAPGPLDLPTSGRPIVGFVGALYEWIDWPLITRVARRLPELDFVFVGPVDGRSDPAAAAALPNVRLLGPRPYGVVPSYMAGFDVCWVPFSQDRISSAANPVKIYEYLALGKPVVSTPVADTDSFGAHLAVARDADAMVAAIRAALDQRESNVAERMRFADENSWQRRARDYVAFAGQLCAAGAPHERPAPPPPRSPAMGSA